MLDISFPSEPVLLPLREHVEEGSWGSLSTHDMGPLRPPSSPLVEASVRTVPRKRAKRVQPLVGQCGVQMNIPDGDVRGRDTPLSVMPEYEDNPVIGKRSSQDGFLESREFEDERLFARLNHNDMYPEDAETAHDREYRQSLIALQAPVLSVGEVIRARARGAEQALTQVYKSFWLKQLESDSMPLHFDRVRAEIGGVFATERSAKNPEYLFITINPGIDDFPELQKRVIRFLSKKWVLSWIYAFEQRSENLSTTPAFGYHCHLLIRKTSKCMAECRREMISPATFGSLLLSNVRGPLDIQPQQGDEQLLFRRIRYIQGIKEHGSEESRLAHSRKSVADAIWRNNLGLVPLYNGCKPGSSEFVLPPIRDGTAGDLGRVS